MDTARFKDLAEYKDLDNTLILLTDCKCRIGGIETGLPKQTNSKGKETSNDKEKVKINILSC